MKRKHGSFNIHWYLLRTSISKTTLKITVNIALDAMLYFIEWPEIIINNIAGYCQYFQTSSCHCKNV